ncbi:MAG: cobyrinic acid a,c-diamide synthase [Cyanobacteria bacterium J06598_3]
MSTFDPNDGIPILSSLPPEANDWLTTLPWQQRRYVLSLCHMVCATPSAQQAEFLDAYTAEGLLSHIVDDADTRQRVNQHLARFRSTAELDDDTVRRYIRQVYVHSVQDARSRPDLYLETALKLMGSAQEHSSVLSYILGFEILKLMFSMSWEQHERLYHLQPNQDDFTRDYIRPVQDAHKRHGIVKPKGEKNFFARRDYFIRQPKINPQRMIELVIESFTADKIIELGFAVLRHPNAIHYDYTYIYGPKQPTRKASEPTKETAKSLSEVAGSLSIAAKKQPEMAATQAIASDQVEADFKALFDADTGA